MGCTCLITRRSPTVLLEPVDQSLHWLSPPRARSMKRAASMCIPLVRERDAEAQTPPIRSDCAAARGLVTHDAPRPVLRTSSSMALSRTTDHARFTSKGCVPLPRAEHARHHGLVVCRAQRHCGAATPWTAAAGFSSGSAGRTRCLLGGANERAIASVHGPVDRALGIGVRRHGRKATLPETRLAPARETAGPRAPRLRACRHSAPRGTGAPPPQEAVEEAARLQSGATRGRFLRWKQRLEPLPWRVGAFCAFHTGE